MGIPFWWRRGCIKGTGTGIYRKNKRLDFFLNFESLLHVIKKLNEYQAKCIVVSITALKYNREKNDACARLKHWASLEKNYEFDYEEIKVLKMILGSEKDEVVFDKAEKLISKIVAINEAHKVVSDRIEGDFHPPLLLK